MRSIEMHFHLLVVIIIISSITSTKEAENESGIGGVAKKQKISRKIKFEPFTLREDYNKLQVPSSGYVTAQLEGRDKVRDEYFDSGMEAFLVLYLAVTLRIRNVNEIDERNEEITFSADLIVEWKDEVIAYDARNKFIDPDDLTPAESEPLFKTLDAEFLTKIWKPDIYIENLVKIRHPEVMSEPVSVRLNEATGEVIYLSRLRVQMECKMDLHYYPADTQSCEVLLRSNSYSKGELQVYWARPMGAFLEDCAGPNFDFHMTSVAEGLMSEGYHSNKSRIFSVLRFKIVARRKLSYHLVQTYLPSIFFIIITWLCFLIPSKMVEARIGICMTTLLTLTAMFASVRESTPVVSYVRAIDIWMVACIFFVFLTLLEFTVVLWLRNTKDDSGEKKIDHEVDIGDDDENGVEFKSLKESGHRRRRTGNDFENAAMKMKIGKYLETSSILLFSIGFVVFTAIYWCWLLMASEYFVWNVNPDFNCANPNQFHLVPFQGQLDKEL